METRSIFSVTRARKRTRKRSKSSTRDENNDGLLVILAPQAVTEPSTTAERLRSFAKLKNKPILASWIGGVGVRPGVEILDRAGIPTFEYPDAAARTFCAMWRYSHNLDALYETPDADADRRNRKITAEQIINRAKKSRAHTAKRSTIEATCWRPTEFRRRNKDRKERRGGCRACEKNRRPGRAEDFFGNNHA